MRVVCVLSTRDVREGVQTNLVAYKHHQIAAGALFWLPVLVLHLIDTVGLADALVLQAVYYFAVVVFEVPSGWSSDRFGRVITMRVAAVAWIGAHALFLASSGPSALVAAQILLALGYACLSGTDSTLHLDSLESLGRTDEFDDRESRVRRRMLATTAVAALAGGALGAIDFRLVFVASIAAAIAQLGFAMRLVEPPRPTTPTRDDRRRRGFGADLRVAMSSMRTGIVGWLALCVVVQVTIVHLAADLTPPYLSALVDGVDGDPLAGVVPSGIVGAAVAIAGAVAVGFVPRVARRIGIPATLIAAGLVPVLILVAMSAVEAWWLLPLLAFRGTQGATVSVLAPRVVASHVGTDHRATVLSMMSLGGRLAYGGTLLVVSAATDGTGDALRLSAVIAAVALAVVATTQRLVPRDQRALAHAHPHVHEPVEHDHLHRHDDGHHDHVDHHHDDLDLGDGPVIHAHPHRHARIEHSHPHTSDVHHRHEH